jgi:hypothetical protein
LSGDPKHTLGPSDPQQWDDDRPTEIKVDQAVTNAVRALDSSEVAVRSADQTDEHPVVLQHDLEFLSPLPEFVAAQLEVLSGPHTAGPFALATVRTRLGRGQDADVRINDTKMSKIHASITYCGSEFRVRDEKSTNGTFLNGSRVVEYVIRDGDKVLVGDSLLRFKLGSGA